MSAFDRDRMLPSSASCGLELTAQQREAVDKVDRWYRSSGRPIFRLFGYAGTGKTTLASQIVDRLPASKVRFAAYTGKAAYVLRTKGCAGASTIHHLIYMPMEKVRAHLKKLEAELERETDPERCRALQRQIEREQRRLETPDFILREETELDAATLLVLDEVSMVGYRIAMDLLSFGVKLLVLGDPAQLPPVASEGYFIKAEPDHLLTEIHRSALHSPVTRLATTVRNSELGQWDYGLQGQDGRSGRRSAIGDEQLLEFDQILAGLNQTRWKLIQRIRDLRGFRSATPVAGDRIIALTNSPEADVFNGQQFTVTGCPEVEEHEDVLYLQVIDDEGQERPLKAWKCGFEGFQGERAARLDGRGRVAAATFGQVITVHKAQGSQWDKVLVADEAHIFAGVERRNAERRGEADSARRGFLSGRSWLYTAITRAAEQVVIAPPRALTMGATTGPRGTDPEAGRRAA